MLKNAPTLAIVAVHTEENEPPRILISNITNIYIHYLEPSHRVGHREKHDDVPEQHVRAIEKKASRDQG